MENPQTSVLLRSKEGLSLPTELCLRIVEEVVAADPKVGAGSLMKVSKAFHTLLHSFQYSIVREVATTQGTIDRYPAVLLPSWPRSASISPHTYYWLCEVRCRTDVVKCLSSLAVIDMCSSDGRAAIDVPRPAVCQCQIHLRADRFAKDSLSLLYSMVDNTATSKDIHTNRASQLAFLETLSATQLAILAVFVRLLGVGYFKLAKTYSDKTADSIRDRWIVFEDRLLRHGPFFAYATTQTIAGHAGETIRAWADAAMAEGLKDMEAFESGKKRGYASMQSVVWKLFCAKADCELFDSWEEAKELVEHEIENYEIPHGAKEL